MTTSGRRDQNSAPGRLPLTSDPGSGRNGLASAPGSANSLGRRRRQSREYLMTTHKVGYLIGSLAKGSINRKLAKALVRLAPSELQMTEIAFKDLPLHSYEDRK